MRLLLPQLGQVRTTEKLIGLHAASEVSFRVAALEPVCAFPPDPGPTLFVPRSMSARRSGAVPYPSGPPASMILLIVSTARTGISFAPIGHRPRIVPAFSPNRISRDTGRVKLVTRR